MSIRYVFKKVAGYIKSEVVLSIALILAIVSAFIIKPDKEYISYIDYRTIALLFCLMTIMQGFISTGVFKMLAEKLLFHVSTFRQLYIVLVVLCFVCSMWITNDVTLITFIPFTILVLKMAHLEKEMIPVIVLQTVAANLGSMCTPVGNPQNIYLYSVSGMSVMDFIRVMGPLSVISLIMILLVCLLHKNYKVEVNLSGSRDLTDGGILSSDESSQLVKNLSSDESSQLVKNLSLDKCDIDKSQQKKLCENIILLISFVISLLTVARILPYQYLLIIIVCVCIILNIVFHEKLLFLSIDYNLLLTFIAFFVFIGNMGRIDIVRTVINTVLSGREVIVSFLCSQVISNVPSAILLSGFTTEYKALMIGVNIGGLGTVIASLASLISYKFYAQEIKKEKEEKGQDNYADSENSIGKYMLHFTIVNVSMAVVLIIAAYI